VGAHRGAPQADQLQAEAVRHTVTILGDEVGQAGGAVDLGADDLVHVRDGAGAATATPVLDPG
jgi:hypothetical protein